MLIVTNENQTESLIQFNNFQMEQEVNGLLQISFTSLNVQSNPAHSLLLEESVITVGNCDFSVKQLKENDYPKQLQQYIYLF